jgi:hypothetical protein
MNDPILLRSYVREVLALAPCREFTERMLFDSVNRLSRDPLTVDELKAAIQWNAGKSYVASRHDEDKDAEVWGLTKNGKSKEGVK